jgi:hypothetical protein
VLEVELADRDVVEVRRDAAEIGEADAAVLLELVMEKYLGVVPADGEVAWWPRVRCPETERGPRWVATISDGGVDRVAAAGGWVGRAGGRLKLATVFRPSERTQDAGEVFAGDDAEDLE